MKKTEWKGIYIYICKYICPICESGFSLVISTVYITLDRILTLKKWTLNLVIPMGEGCFSVLGTRKGIYM